jgi:hypothetical protein
LGQILNLNQRVDRAPQVVLDQGLHLETHLASRAEQADLGLHLVVGQEPVLVAGEPDARLIEIDQEVVLTGVADGIEAATEVALTANFIFDKILLI